MRLESHARICGDDDLTAGRPALPGAYAFFSRYVLMPWESVLDVGGGLGVGKAILQQRTKRVRSIDKDSRLQQNGVEIGDIGDESDGSFDWVISIDVIEHIDNDMGFLKELLRVAKKGVFVTTPNVTHHPELNWPYHVREYTNIQFRQLFMDAIPEASVFHFGGDVHCGRLSMRHLTSTWEHQGILCCKQDTLFRRLLILVHELLCKMYHS